MGSARAGSNPVAVVYLAVVFPRREDGRQNARAECEGVC